MYSNREHKLFQSKEFSFCRYCVAGYIYPKEQREKMTNWRWVDEHMVCLYQWCNRYKTCIVIGSYCLYLSLIHFFSSMRPNILCIKDVFGGIINLRWYRILVSLSKYNTCVLSQESETTQIQYFLVFKFWDNTNKRLIPSCLVSTRNAIWTPSVKSWLAR
jgi:hypothetical protein